MNPPSGHLSLTLRSLAVIFDQATSDLGRTQLRRSRSFFVRHVTVIWVAQSKHETGFFLFTYHHHSSALMVSTRQRGKSHKPTEGSPPPADSGDEYEEQTPAPRKTRGAKRVKTTAGGNQHQKRRKTAKLSRLPDMPIDILYEVRRSLP